MPSVSADNLQQLFAEVPKTYERLNHILTLGLDVGWRKRAARIAARGGGNRWLDVCSGTGEMAVLLARHAPGNTELHAVDFSPEMLAEAKKKPEAKRITFHVADVKTLPFEDRSFDLVTISFATRNLNTSRDALVKAFAEFHRVLRSGGRFVNLETSQPTCVRMRRCFHAFVRLFVEPIGGRVSGSRRAYAYLARTIPRFYGAEELADIMRDAGFAHVRFERLLFGAAAVHTAVRE
ncbi:MAG: ubiquinone/menaquinone biosynthesis methyltransferase [Planctomycetota bacterium]|nr:ubiquinone/menaquinone biosynthesis methyltransferase [Planctomycetota bacterium]